MASSTKFALLLTEGIKKICIYEDKLIQVVQDELGYALGRKTGGSAIEYWRRGHIPAKASDVEHLARCIAKRGNVGREWVRQFLESANYPHMLDLCDELFPASESRDAIVEARRKLVDRETLISDVIAALEDSGEQWLLTIEKGGTLSIQPHQHRALKKEAIPHNLPPRSEFIGREEQKVQLRDALASRSFLVCVDGIGGIGKTALALEIAYECLASSQRGREDQIPIFDAFVWTTAKDRDLSLQDIVDTIARTLDYPYITRLPWEEKPFAVAKLLRARCCLLIVDNFETITDNAVAEFLRNLPEPSKSLVTSREQKLREARAISLRGMAQDEALTLIRSEGRRLGLAAVVQATDATLLRLYQATGGAPLAIKWAVGQIKQRGQSLDTVLDSLYEARGDVFESIFARSWKMLSEDARSILMAITIFGTSATKPAIEATSNVRTWGLEEGLGQLVELSLVEVSSRLEKARQRYGIHPLTRAFARRKLQADKRSQQRSRERFVHYFSSFAVRAENENWRVYDEVEQEIENVFGSIDIAREMGDMCGFVKLVDALNAPGYLYVRGYFHQIVVYNEQAAELYEKRGENGKAAHHRSCVAAIHLARGDLAKAEKLYRQTLEVFRQLGDRENESVALHQLGGILCEQGQPTQGKEVLLESLAIAEQIGDRTGMGTTYHQLGIEEMIRDENEQAKRYHEKARELHEASGDVRYLAKVLNTLGDLACKGLDLETAEQLLTRSLEIVDQLDDKLQRGYTSRTLSLLEDLKGNKERASEFATQAQAILSELGVPLLANAISRWTSPQDKTPPEVFS